MGLASYLVWEAGTPLSALAFKLYAAQLVFNLAWQPLFFNLQNLEVAQIDNLGKLADAAEDCLLQSTCACRQVLHLAVCMVRSLMIALTSFAECLDRPDHACPHFTG